MTDTIECTREKPWNRVAAALARVRHHDTREIGEQEQGWPAGDIVTVECLNCSTRWKMELPQ